VLPVVCRALNASTCRNCVHHYYREYSSLRVNFSVTGRLSSIERLDVSELRPPRLQRVQLIKSQLPDPVFPADTKTMVMHVDNVMSACIRLSQNHIIMRSSLHEATLRTYTLSVRPSIRLCLSVLYSFVTQNGGWHRQKSVFTRRFSVTNATCDIKRLKIKSQAHT